MTTKKNLFIGLSIFVFGLALVATPVYAEETKKTVADVRCTVAEKRIKAHLSVIQALRESKVNVYQKILDRLDKLTNSAEDNGYDTTKLIAAKADSQTAYDSFITNATNYETALNSTKDYACGESEGQFKNALATARTQLATVRTSSQTLKTTITSKLIPAVKDYAAWLKEHPVTNSPDTTEGN